MSEPVKRYIFVTSSLDIHDRAIGHLQESPDGDYILAADYDTLTAAVAKAFANETEEREEKRKLRIQLVELQQTALAAVESMQASIDLTEWSLKLDRIKELAQKTMPKDEP